MPASKPDTETDKGDATLPASQTSAPEQIKHILHEVAVQADGTEDPGACIEQMVESQAESGSSLLTHLAENAPDHAVPQVPAILKPPKKPV